MKLVLFTTPPKLLVWVCFGAMLPLACKKDFLDRQPYGGNTENILCENLTGADQVLIGAYSALDGFTGWDKGVPWGSAASNWLFGSVAGADAHAGSDAGDQPPTVSFEVHRLTPYNEYVAAKWSVLYDAIHRCNDAILCFQHIGSSNGLQATRLGEARFLRGHFHFEAKKIWNRVPYIDETVADYRIPNDRDIWPDIEADLKAASESLPWTQPEIGRATKGAALALLGKAYLFQQKYAEAKAAFDAVIQSGQYQLTPSYHENFNAATRHNPEAVFVVQQAVNEGSDGENGNIGDVLNFPYGGTSGVCCGFHQPTQNLVNAFRTDANGLPFLDTYNEVDVKNDDGLESTDPFEPESGTLDPRLDWTVGRRGIPYLDWGAHPGKSWIRNQAFGGPYSPKKNVFYRSQEGIYSNKTGWAKTFSAQTIKLIRYADVLLMAAECEVALGQLEQARSHVNAVRQRAANPAGWVRDSTGKPAANYLVREYNAPFPNAAVALKAVRHERRIELGMEGHRFFDLVRWGVAAEEKLRHFEVAKKKRTFLNWAQFTAGKDEYAPIPQRIIDRSWKNNAPTLRQNPGY